MPDPRPAARSRLARAAAALSLAAAGCTAPAPAPDGGCGEPLRAFAATEATAAPVALADVTRAAGLPESVHACLVAADFDRDGRDDLLLAPADPEGRFGGRLVVYRNAGDGTFTAHPSAVDLDAVIQCASADLDRDGRADVVAVGDRGGERGVVRLLRGAGDGLSFEPRADRAAELIGPTPVRAVALYDHDGDGYADLLVGYHPLDNNNAPYAGCDISDADVTCRLRGEAPRAASVLLRATDGGRDFAPGFALPRAANTNALAVFDVDADGAPDLFQCNEFGPNALYRNARGGLVDLLEGGAAAVDNFCMGVAFADLDADGRGDFYVADLGPDQLYRACGGLRDEAGPAGVAAATRAHSGWSPQAADFNLDGLVDVFVGNSILLNRVEDLFSDATVDREQADFVFEAVGGRGFVTREVPHRTGARDIGTMATALLDADGDGRVEVAVAFYPDPVLGMKRLGAGLRRPEFRLLHNDTARGANHWVAVRLSRVDRSPVAGAVVTLEDPSFVAAPWRAVGAGGVGASSDVAHFGLGPRAALAGLTVRWPWGPVQRVPGPLAVDRVIDVRAP